MIKICRYMVTPSMRCTEIAGHDTLPIPTNHVSNGAWISLVEVLEYASIVLKRNGMENSGQYILDQLKDHDL